MSSNKKNDKKNIKKLQLPRVLTVFMLLALLIIGLVSTTFASFVVDNSIPDDGSLVARIQTAVSANREKKDLASLGADTYYLAGTMNGWNATSTPMTQGTDTNGQTFYYSGYYSNQEQFKVVKNGSTWLGHEKNSSSVYPNSLSMYQYGNSGNCWPGSGGYYVVYNPTQDKISCVTVLPLKVEEVVFEAGDVVYFDIRNNTEWLTADSSSKMYIQFNNSTTGSTSASDRAQLTQIGTYLYKYEFTADCKSSIRFWRGNSSSMWNHSNPLSPDDGNGVYITSGGWSGSGTVATFSLTSIGTPSLTVSPDSIDLGETTTLSSSTTSPTINYKIGSTSYTTTAVSGDIKYTFKNGTTALNTASTTASYTWKPTAAGTYSTYVTITSASTGLSATSSAKTLTVKELYAYTVTANTGGTVSAGSGSAASAVSGSVVAGESVSITAKPNTGYTFAGWTCTKGSVASSSATTTEFTPSATGATAKANFIPNAPSALTLTGSPVASGTTGTGTQANPYIVFENSSFTLTAKATVVSGATAYYNSTNNSTNAKDSGQFTPPDTTKGETVSYAVYAWAEAGTYYSTNSKSATAYYMVFSHLNGANTGFTMSSNSITDADTLTLSGAYVNGVADAEKAHITQTYQVSSDNSTFTDMSGSTWTPNETGTYYFRVKTHNKKTGETVYSTSQTLTVTQSTVYYDITVTNDGDIDGTVTLKADGVEITDGKILSNSKLTVSITRPSSNYYIDYLEVDTLTEQDCEDVNGDITNYVAYDHVKGNVEIHYKIVEKPTVTVEKPTNADSISFKYYVDGTLTTKTAAGTYHVDYDSKITYTVTPKSSYYVSAMTGVTIDELKAGAVEGTKSGVTANISSVTATLSNNRTVAVSIDSTSDVKTGGSMTIDGVALGFGQPKPLNYGATSTIVITPPDGCYAVVSGNNVESTIDTDGKATFDVTLTGTNKNYTVKFVYNPKIYMVQPQYGSVYVTDGLGNYYFNGDSVGYGTELIVNVQRDHANATVNSVLVNDASIGTADGTKFKIYEDSTATADITVKSGHEFEKGTEYGQRRIFFTDNSGWGDGQVMVHYSNTNSNYTFTDGNTKAMTFKYVNDANQRVYYADIPYNFKYVNFYKKSATSSYTASALINGEANAFWHSGGTSPYTITPWQENYSDFVATDRADTIQQATTVKDEAATFSYTCDFGDDALKAEVVSGNAATFSFDKGKFSITPTENSKPYSLVKVTSNASTTVKYYLIRVENFEIVDFSGIQKIYRSGIINNIQLDLIVKGGVLNYAADLFVSDSNYANSYEELTPNKTAGFVYQGSIEAYTNSFLLENYINNGMKFFKIQAKDSANHKATATLKTLFGTNTYNGTRCVYFYNNTGDSISKYDLRACFNSTSDPDKSEHRFVTMQKVGNTNYYRAVVPNGFESSVNFYLANQKTFSNVYADYDGTGDTVETYDYGIRGVEIPQTDEANIVYEATEIGTNGITGSFIQFDH